MAMAMVVSAAAPSASLSAASSDQKPFEPNNEAIRKRLLRKGVFPTPKILHALRKKETQKALRRAKKQALQVQPSSVSESQSRDLENDDLFRTVSAEYRAVREEFRRRDEKAVVLAGKPWEGSKAVDLRDLTSARETLGDGRLRTEHLEELRRMLAERNGEQFRLLLINDEVEDTGCDFGNKEVKKPPKSWLMIEEEERIRLLVDRLSSSNLSMQDWKFSWMMRKSDILFTEMSLLKIIERLGHLGKWSSALSVVEWVYNEKNYKHKKSRFVYTKLLSVLGKERRPIEALQLFKKMQEDGQLYPDMAAYHSISVTLGQAGLVHELINIINCMKVKPSRKLKNMNRRNWDPCMEPDIVIYNAVLNACIPSHQWKGVFWVLEQMRYSGFKPTGATYGLAMEVMLKAGKYDLVHKFFEKMRKGGIAPKAQTYRVLVRAFWEEGKIDDALEVVMEMEHRGVVGAASVYYELACCLCNKGRWRDAMIEVEKLKRVPFRKPLEVAFTGMILASLDGGFVSDCISIFEHMKDHCAPNVGTINAMLKVYSCADMFAKAKELFEATKATHGGLESSGNYSSLQLDSYSYKSMLEASASSQQWEYFEYVYKEMILSGFKLDHRKFSWCLVKASRAGKWHLLEHAFDTILEAEEIPHTSLFMEMICQTIAQGDLGRTVSLLNSMAHASLSVSESQWTSLLERQIATLGMGKLQDLLNHLQSCSLVMEDPVPIFLKSLHLISGRRFLEGTESVAGSIGSLENDEKIKDYQHVDVPGRIDGRSPSLSSTSYSCSLVEMLDAESSANASLLEEFDNLESSSPAGAQRSEHSCFEHNEEFYFTDSTLDLLTSGIRTPFPESPPASEILERWRIRQED
ncbi:pentatricopeptide repeat-containing protein At5g67570, chloroplastic [Zingiber officinale]|uniref:PROP1-like PPR domain-containing protein n=1 Tax=Zingiber officinale TaxID=94328 RepID=A0A8J5H388_ZINOF|nr:pentatricopeptide repeat-containing protein At5g67570, chloroplastic [Zingiber officinale]KAG6514709.1 hypothetical protein ZIOFF_025079 [Zingiber officinale]